MNHEHRPKNCLRIFFRANLLIALVLIYNISFAQNSTPQDTRSNDTGPKPTEEEAPQSPSTASSPKQPGQEAERKSNSGDAAPSNQAPSEEMISVRASDYRKLKSDAEKANAENSELRALVANYESKVKDLESQMKEKDGLLDASRKEVADLKSQRDKALQDAEQKRTEAQNKIVEAEQKSQLAAIKTQEAQKTEKQAQFLFAQGSTKYAEAKAIQALAERMKQEASNLSAEADRIKKRGLELMNKANTAIAQAKAFQEQLEAWMKRPGNSIKRVDVTSQGSSVTYNGTTSNSVGVQGGITYESPAVSGRSSINFNLVGGTNDGGYYSNRNTKAGLALTSPVSVGKSGNSYIQPNAGVREQGVLASSRNFTITSQTSCVEGDLNFINALNSGRVRIEANVSGGAGESYVYYSGDGARGESRFFPLVLCGNASLGLTATSANGRHSVQAGANAAATYRVVRSHDERAIASSVELYLKYRFKTGEKFGGFISAGAQYEVMDIKNVPGSDYGPGANPGTSRIVNINAGVHWDTPFASSPPKPPAPLETKKTAE